MYKAFLIKYGEIGVKGKNRHLFEDALCHQIRYSLRRVDGDFKVSKENGRIYVEALGEYDYEDTVDALKCVFGIVGICPMVQIEDTGFDDLAKEVISHIDDVYKDKHITFKVDARRARKNYPLNSMEINMQLGEKILEAAGFLAYADEPSEGQLSLRIQAPDGTWQDLTLCLRAGKGASS